MSLQNAIRSSYNALCRLLYQTMLLLLHPNTKYSNLLLAELTQDRNTNALYYSLNHNDRKISQFLNNLIQALREQTNDAELGEKLLTDLNRNPGRSAEELASKLAEVFKGISPEPYLIILDNFDLSNNNSMIQELIQHLLELAPKHLQIILNAREMPSLPWLEMLAKNQANIFSDNGTIPENFQTHSQPNVDGFSAFALNGGTVYYKNKPISNFEGNLPKLLFFYILNRGAVTRQEILNAFWPGLSEEQAVNVFHVTKRRLHKALGMDIVVHENEQYMLDPNTNIYYDVQDFVNNIAQARESQTKDLWRKAISLHQAPFLEGFDEAWVQFSRKAYEQALEEATSHNQA